MKLNSNHSEHTSIAIFAIVGRLCSIRLGRVRWEKKIFAQFNVLVWKLSEELQFNLGQLINRKSCVFRRRREMLFVGFGICSVCDGALTLLLEVMEIYH